MRVVVLGPGGIGGTIGARLHQAGYAVALIARGAHGEAVRERGLTFETPKERVTLRIPAYQRPGDVDWRDAMGLSDSYVIATPAQVDEMRREIAAVVSRYRRVGQGNPEARRVATYTVLYPLDLDRPPRGERS